MTREQHEVSTQLGDVTSSPYGGARWRHQRTTELVRLSLLHLPIPKQGIKPEHDLRRAAAAHVYMRPIVRPL